jgi:hypothetical protein
MPWRREKSRYFPCREFIDRTENAVRLTTSALDSVCRSYGNPFVNFVDMSHAADIRKENTGHKRVTSPASSSRCNCVIQEGGGIQNSQGGNNAWIITRSAVLAGNLTWLSVGWVVYTVGIQSTLRVCQTVTGTQPFVVLLRDARIRLLLSAEVKLILRLFNDVVLGVIRVLIDFLVTWYCSNCGGYIGPNEMVRRLWIAIK